LRTCDPQRHVLYIIGAFPRLSETFVLNEVIWLQNHGLDILPVSLCKRKDVLNEPLGKRGQAMLDITVYVMDHFRQSIIPAALRAVKQSPKRLARAIRTNLEMPNHGSSRIGRLAFALLCADMAARNNITHIHGHWDYPSDVALLTSELAGLPFSLTAHAHDIFETGDALPYKVKKAKFIITCNEYNRQYLADHLGVEYQSKIHRVYHGLEPAIFGPLAKRNSEIPVILGVGRLVRYKGFHRLVEACHQLRDQGYIFRCRIVGQGSQYEPLTKQIKEANLQNCVELLGALPHDEVLRLYDESDIFVLPADVSDGQYGLPNVLFEAMARGLAVITTQELPPIKELINDSENGILVRAGEMGALVSALASLITKREERVSLGRRAATSVEQFNIENNLPRLLNLY
jgi:colanic acid/amylovoran biosynthesis glycosyltransferase